MTAKNFIKGLMVGGVAGLAAGMLYAPKSGKETRQQIRKSTEDALNKAKIQYEDIRKKVVELADRQKNLYGEQKEKIKKAFDAGKDAYKTEKS